MNRFYLAVPYRGREEESFEAVTQAAAKLVRMGHAVYSPITHSHPICKVDPDLPGHFDFWEEMDYSIISLWATEVMVLCLPGWEDSVGVRKEVEYARALGKNVTFIDPKCGWCGKP